MDIVVVVEGKGNEKLGEAGGCFNGSVEGKRRCGPVEIIVHGIRWKCLWLAISINATDPTSLMVFPCSLSL
jgi:hypothetical protein